MFVNYNQSMKNFQAHLDEKNEEHWDACYATMPTEFTEENVAAWEKENKARHDRDVQAFHRASFWSKMIDFSIFGIAVASVFAGIVLVMLVVQVVALVAFVPALAALFYFASGKYQELYFWLDNRFRAEANAAAKTAS